MISSGMNSTGGCFSRSFLCFLRTGGRAWVGWVSITGGGGSRRSFCVCWVGGNVRGWLVKDGP